MPYSRPMSQLRTQFPVFFRLAAWLGLLAMLAPVLAGFAHHTGSTQSFMRLCGMAMAPVEGAHHTHSKDAPDKIPSCPICQSLHSLAGGFVPPDVVLLTLPLCAGTITCLVVLVFALGVRPEPNARPRAPPVFA